MAPTILKSSNHSNCADTSSSYGESKDLGALHAPPMPHTHTPAILSISNVSLRPFLKPSYVSAVQVTAEVVGTGSDGTEPSLLFSVQRHGVYSSDVTLLKRYLFNCGEGTQRLCGENGVKLSSLDSMFFTRFDVNSVSGVPGMIFSLSTCGAASLKLHGPVGLRGFLVAIRSFVRRKYPQITCVEVSDNDSLSDQASDFNYERWRASEDQSDQHMRIFPILLRSSDGSAHDEKSSRSRCILCQHGDTAPSRSNSSAVDAKQVDASEQQVDRSGREHRESTDESDEHTQFRAWLLRFYTTKVPDKVPYVDVILNRYRGRYDELKTQLRAKYGSIEEDNGGGDGDCGSASTDSSSEEEDSGGDDDDQPDFGALPLNREWLLKFYRRHQPEKLLHVDKVLKQFSGREDTLKQMLLQKYWKPKASESAADSGAPQSKRRKLESTTEASPGATAATGVEKSEQDPPKVFVTPQSSGTTAATTSSSSSLCYIMKFLHEVHAVVWIIDCRSTNHLDDLTAKFRAPSVTGCGDHQPALVVHFSPPSVFQDPRYQIWMASLDSAAQQLVFDGEALRSVENGVYSWVFRASAKHTLEQRPAFGSADAAVMWRNLSSFLSSEQQTKISGETKERSQKQILWKVENGSEVHVAQSKQRFELLRKSDDRQAQCDYERTGWRRQDKSEDDADKDEGAAGDGGDRVEVSEQEQLSQPNVDTENAMKLTILGTGSAAPSKLRGSAGIYLELKERKSVSNHSGSVVPSKELGGADTLVSPIPDAMLIDCGEGTHGQLWRQFGTDTAARIGGLRCIWISHSHADHQCGLVRILYEYIRYHTLQKSHRGLLVLGPQSVLLYARSWMSHIFDSCGIEPDSPARSSFVGFATCREFNQPQHPFRPELFSQIGNVVTQITSVPVWHCYDSYGLVLQLRNGQKIVYSGDTRPCSQLAAAGMHASLLIHEATFDDSMGDDAIKKKHSTVGEALEVARQMRAQEVVLTHFSQRYPKLPPPVAGGNTLSAPPQATARVHCAFDGYVHNVPT